MPSDIMWLAADAGDSSLGVKLTPQPQRCTWPHLWRTMARCAGHGFDDVADEDGIAWQGQMVVLGFSGAGDHCGQ